MIKENKEKESNKLEDKIYEDLGYEWRLCKASRIKPFCG